MAERECNTMRRPWRVEQDPSGAAERRSRRRVRGASVRLGSMARWLGGAWRCRCQTTNTQTRLAFTKHRQATASFRPTLQYHTSTLQQPAHYILKPPWLPQHPWQLRPVNTRAVPEPVPANWQCSLHAGPLQHCNTATLPSATRVAAPASLFPLD